MKRWQAQAEAAFLFRVADNFDVGPMASYDYVIGKHIERPGVTEWNGSPYMECGSRCIAGI